MKKRQINKAKRVSNNCRNHGSCDYCKGSRTYSNKHREPLDEYKNLKKQFEEYYLDPYDNEYLR